MNPRQNITHPIIKGGLQFDDESILYTARSSISGSIDIVFTKEYLIELATASLFKVNKIFLKLDQGSCLLNILVNNLAVIEEITVTDSLLTINPTDLRINPESSISLEILDNTDSFGLSYSIHTEQINNE